MNAPPSEIYGFEKFRLDAVKRLLTDGGGAVLPLAPKAFETLLYLVRNPGKLHEKEEMMRAIWTDTIVEENNLNQSISVLRRVLGERRDEHRFIVTVPGRGYKFVAEVRVISDLGFGFSDVKPEEIVPENEFEKTDNRITDDKPPAAADE